MTLIRSFVNREGQKVIQRFEKIKKSPSWGKLLLQGLWTLAVLVFAIIVLFFCWIVSRVKCFGAWLGLKYAQARLHYAKRARL